ncbi:helix-hairpin-helix domain-containing protein [Bacillus sp. ISL-7]|uniref:helix-hairpin-helix domain-containing protein n=1 Tax=Bacillus sp. ISL-7 TaxID=2819136 RepID=UPI001BEB04B9|nr:hypothetical protein [Bacillus sp. ISL-7]MBT2736223.1 hypothetical protein [Bacillus sp. ISL-7]
MSKATNPKCTDSKGNILKIGKMIGRGGEGTVYEVEGKPGNVLKIYHKYDDERSKKIAIMSNIKNERLLKYTSWPIDTVKDASGKVLGMLMPTANGKEIHKLYNPKNRLSEFENVSLRFLIHTAANISRSFAVVHDSGQVIGDVNHGNILVSNDGTVKLIDCDSFQISSKGNLLLCGVGVSTHQPPELQSKSLSNIVRTANHDNFGLAIIIFQLLFMGRHPFAGRYLGSGDMPIEKAIEQYRFAYGKNAKQREMQQPPATFPLDFYSKELAELFEKAFSQKGSLNENRPKATEWIIALEKLNKELITCSLNQAHFYNRNHKNCPWCEYESRTGLILFSAIIKSKLGNDNVFQLDLFWKRISSINLPFEQDLPDLNSISPEPDEEIIKIGKNFKRKKTIRLAGALILGIFSLFLTFYGVVGIYPLGGVIASIVIGSRKAKTEQYDEIYKGYENFNRKWNTLLERWKKEASSDKFFSKMAELKNYKLKYVEIPNIRAMKLKQLEKDQRNRQLNEYLDRFYIQSSNIDSIGPSRKAVLQSYGIETARDVSKQAVLSVPGFGPSLTNNVVEWRKNIEKRFSFDPKKGISKSDLYSLEKEIFALKSDIEKKLTKGEAELNYIKTTILNRRENLKREADECVRILCQTKANVDFLKSVL